MIHCKCPNRAQQWLTAMCLPFSASSEGRIRNLGLGRKIGTFWDHFYTLVLFGTKSRIRDFIGAPACILWMYSALECRLCRVNEQLLNTNIVVIYDVNYPPHSFFLLFSPLGITQGILLESRGRSLCIPGQAGWFLQNLQTKQQVRYSLNLYLPWQILQWRGTAPASTTATPETYHLFQHIPQRWQGQGPVAKWSFLTW